MLACGSLGSGEWWFVEKLWRISVERKLCVLREDKNMRREREREREWFELMRQDSS